MRSIVFAGLLCLSLLPFPAPFNSYPGASALASGGKEQDKQDRIRVPQSSRVRGLPNDEWMLAYFRANRQSLEELVALYQTDKLFAPKKVGDFIQPVQTERYKEIKRRTGIYHVTNDGAVWLPSAYSKEAGAQVRKMDLVKSYKYHGIIVGLEHDLTYATSREIRRVIWKSFFYVPIVPRIENSWLMWPVDERGEIFRKKRVVNDLDEFQLSWFRQPPKDLPEISGCVFRQLETQWFVVLCNG